MRCVRRLCGEEEEASEHHNDVGVNSRFAISTISRCTLEYKATRRHTAKLYSDLHRIFLHTSENRD